MNPPREGRRIGLFGGSFDPPHNAHLALATLALHALSLDELRWIPAGQPWQKNRTITAATHREAMVRLAMDDEPRFVLERCELERQGPSYTLDTVRELGARELAEHGRAAHWYLLIGQDQYAGLHTWHGWRELLGLVTLAVANRPGAPLSVDAQVAAVVHQVVPLPLMDLASTDIRERALAGRDLAALVPAGVARYIDNHHLYQAHQAPQG